jgi:integrase
MAKKKRRTFGRVRKLPSGRYQARYPGPDGVLRPAATTFATAADAAAWLDQTEAKMRLGEWFNPDGGLVAFGNYADEWLADRPLAPKTRQTYEGLLRLHIKPALGMIRLADLDSRTVRRWQGRLAADGKGQVIRAKAYRLLRTILNTAVDDGLIPSNSCKIKGAGIERSPERPALDVGQVFKLAAAIGERWRALVLLAAFAHLRWGELAALRRHCLNLDARTVQVQASQAEVGSELILGPPKSKAGERTVTFPAVIVPTLQHHLDTFAQPGRLGLVFVGEKGAPLRRCNFSDKWATALEAAGLPDVHFHDLRHSGNTWAASTGASLSELMRRMGHASSDAALRYQHATSDRDRAIADALDRLAEAQTDNVEDDEGHDESA